jgi:hypothetical protein
METYNEYHFNQSGNIESTGWESFTSSSNIWMSPSFLMQNSPSWQLSIKNFYTQFEYGLVTDSLSQVDDRHGVHAKHYIFPLQRMHIKQRMVNIMGTAGPLKSYLHTTYASKIKDWLKKSDIFCMSKWYIHGCWLSWVQQNWLVNRT